MSRGSEQAHILTLVAQTHTVETYNADQKQNLRWIKPPSRPITLPTPGTVCPGGAHVGATDDSTMTLLIQTQAHILDGEQHMPRIERRKTIKAPFRDSDFPVLFAQFLRSI